MASVGRTAGICYSRHSPSITSLNFSTPVKHCLTMPPFSPFSAFKSLTCCLAKSKQAIRATPSPLRPILGISSHSLCALVVAGRAYHGNWSAPPQAAAYEQQGTAEFPRPPVMHWEKDLANAVMLIGYVGRDVDIRYIDSGKVVARTSIAVRTSSVKDEEPSWFEIEIWDELAEIAAHHVKKGERIFVTGRIVIQKWVKEGVQNMIPKVVVKDLCFVENTTGQRPTQIQSTSVPQEQFVGASPQNWNRIDSSKQSQEEAPARPKSSDVALATEKNWQEFFADPTQWWDNRTNKKNPKAPDFKHKSTQDALWIESWNNPSWVAQQLSVLEEKKAEHAGEFRESRGREEGDGGYVGAMHHSYVRK